VSRVSVFWFDDSGKGNCRVPESWKILYRVGEEWKEVETPSGYTTNLDAFNVVRFKPVETTGLRIEAKLKDNFSGGILEWKFR
jgi:hypothetical protein